MLSWTRLRDFLCEPRIFTHQKMSLLKLFCLWRADEWHDHSDIITRKLFFKGILFEFFFNINFLTLYFLIFLVARKPALMRGSQPNRINWWDFFLYCGHFFNQYPGSFLVYLHPLIPPFILTNSVRDNIWSRREKRENKDEMTRKGSNLWEMKIW